MIKKDIQTNKLLNILKLKNEDFTYLCTFDDDKIFYVYDKYNWKYNLYYYDNNLQYYMFFEDFVDIYDIVEYIKNY